MHEHFGMKVELCRIRRERLGLPLTPVPRQDIRKHGCKGLGIPKDPSSMVDQGALPLLGRTEGWTRETLSLGPPRPLDEDRSCSTTSSLGGSFRGVAKKGIAPRIVTQMKEASLLEKYGLLL
eukprot:scaffold1347_cov350-Pavlova_lutheri.AAC.5